MSGFEGREFAHPLKKSEIYRRSHLQRVAALVIEYQITYYYLHVEIDSIVPLWTLAYRRNGDCPEYCGRPFI